MSETNTVEFAGVELEEGDTVHVVYDTNDDIPGAMDEEVVIDSFTYVGSRFMPAHIIPEDGSQHDVAEDNVVEIEKVA